MKKTTRKGRLFYMPTEIAREKHKNYFAYFLYIAKFSCKFEQNLNN